jgi:hypothetical protein
MDRIIPKFNVNVRKALEYCLIHFTRFIRPTPNPSERVVNGDFIGTSEILVHHVQIASIEGTVELSQCLFRLAEVSKFLAACDGLLYGPHSFRIHV